jgi:hypothetical protein
MNSNNVQTILKDVTTTLSRNVGYQTGIGKYSFVNKATKLWSQLPAETQAIFPFCALCSALKNAWHFTSSFRVPYYDEVFMYTENFAVTHTFNDVTEAR